MFNHDFAGKLLQAVAALTHASGLNRDHPELHIRLIDLKQTVKRFQPQPYHTTLVSIFTTAVTSRSHWPGVRRCFVQRALGYPTANFDLQGTMVAQTRHGGQSPKQKLTFRGQLAGKGVTTDALLKKLKTLHDHLATLPILLSSALCRLKRIR